MSKLSWSNLIITLNPMMNVLFFNGFRMKKMIITMNKNGKTAMDAVSIENISNV